MEEWGKCTILKNAEKGTTKQQSKMYPNSAVPVHAVGPADTANMLINKNTSAVKKTEEEAMFEASHGRSLA